MFTDSILSCFPELRWIFYYFLLSLQFGLGQLTYICKKFFKSSYSSSFHRNHILKTWISPPKIAWTTENWGAHLRGVSYNYHPIYTPLSLQSSFPTSSILVIFLYLMNNPSPCPPRHQKTQQNKTLQLFNSHFWFIIYLKHKEIWK